MTMTKKSFYLLTSSFLLILFGAFLNISPVSALTASSTADVSIQSTATEKTVDQEEEIAELSYTVEKMGHYQPQEKTDISPGSHFLTLNPGMEGRTFYSILSYQKEPKSYWITVENVEGPTQLGEGPHYISTNESEYGAKDWIRLPVNEVTINPGEKITLEVAITPPANSDAGDHYAAIILTEKAPEVKQSQGQVGVIGRVASTVYVTVTGNLRYEGELTSFAFNQNFFKNPPKILSNWAKNQPVSFSIIYQNKGTVHLNPHGEIKITNWIGQNTGSIPVNNFIVMRNSIREQEIYSFKTDNRGTTEGVKLSFGLYHAYLTLYDDLGSPYTASLGFWYWPMPATGIILLSILAFIVIIIVTAKQVRDQKKLAQKRRLGQKRRDQN